MTVQRFTHAEARQIINEAFRRNFGRDPERPEAQCVQAVGFLETGYGAGWSAKIPGAAGSNNWGAITAPKSWTGDTFEHRDSYPDEHGVNHWYSTKFKRYPTPIDGATDLVRTVYLIAGRDRRVYEPARNGDARGVSLGLYLTKYYLGFGKNQDERVGNHFKKLWSSIVSAARQIGEPLPVVGEAPAVEEPMIPRVADPDEWLDMVGANIASELRQNLADKSARDALIREQDD